MRLEDIEILVDARDDDTISSWESSTPYHEVLRIARDQCPRGRHVMTLSEYMDLWCRTVKEGGSRACNEADVWANFETDRDDNDPISYIRHPFLSTVLVDTFLIDFKYNPNEGFTANVVNGNDDLKRIKIPETGKIYSLNEFGLPGKTGGRKTNESEQYEHRWWAFTSDQWRANPNLRMALFANGGTIGCFCELIKAHYSMEDSGGFYRVLSLSD